MRTHAICFVLVILAAFCFLLAAFGTAALGPVQLTPAGLCLLALAELAHHVPVA